MAIAKRCSCGATFTRRAWDRLPGLGVKRLSKNGKPDKYELEFKNCPGCQSTLAIPLRVQRAA